MSRRPLPPCRITGCHHTAKSKKDGRCEAHVERERAHPDEPWLWELPIRAKGRPGEIGCKVVGCAGRHHANGYCSRHAAFAWRAKNYDYKRGRQERGLRGFRRPSGGFQ